MVAPFASLAHLMDRASASFRELRQSSGPLMTRRRHCSGMSLGNKSSSPFLNNSTNDSCSGNLRAERARSNVIVYWWIPPNSGARMGTIHMVCRGTGPFCRRTGRLLNRLNMGHGIQSRSSRAVLAAKVIEHMNSSQAPLHRSGNTKDIAIIAARNMIKFFQGAHVTQDEATCRQKNLDFPWEEIPHQVVFGNASQDSVSRHVPELKCDRAQLLLQIQLSRGKT